MATAYTPGLTVSPSTHIVKMRRLPLAGQVVVEKGQLVEPADILARAEIPGIMRTVRVSETLGIEPGEVHQVLQFRQGDYVNRGDILGRTTSFFGLLKNEVKSPAKGVLELINPLSGNVGIREDPLPVEVKAYIRGRVTEVIPIQGAVVETEGALVQGIFGIGGERNGPIRIIASGPESRITADDIPDDVKGQILVGGAQADLSALRKATEQGASGLLVGGVVDADLVTFLGHDIGVAITGQEPIGMTVVFTEGFGNLPMAARTWELLNDLAGQWGSINGATQIRAGVIRPELIVPNQESAGENVTRPKANSLEIGAPVRIIREPYFGELGRVLELPPELQQIPSGASVRILVAQLSSGETVTVPRANVELMEQ